MRTDSKTMATSVCTVAVATVLALAGLFSNTAPVTAQQITLRMHTHVPPVSGSYKSLKWWAQKVEKESGGKLKIQLFGSMQLGGKAPDIYDQVRNGVVDLGWSLPGYKAGLFPVTTAFELPFIGDTASITSPAVNAFLHKYGMKEWGAVHPIVFHSAGVSVLHTKTKQVKTLTDLKGLKIRTPSRLSSAALGALGATPVPIPTLKVTEALMRDVVDGAVLPWSISRAIRTIDAAEFHVETTLHEPLLALLMNKQSYDKLPPDLKKVIDANSGEWLAIEFGRRWEKDDKPGRAKAIKLGHTVSTISEAEQNNWRKATQSVYDSWIKSMDEKGLPGRKMVEDAVALVAKYKAGRKAH